MRVEMCIHEAPAHDSRWRSVHVNPTYVDVTKLPRGWFQIRLRDKHRRVSGFVHALDQDLAPHCKYRAWM